MPWDERLELDARYAEAPPRFATDAAILLRCAWLALAARGATAPGHATMPPYLAEQGENLTPNHKPLVDLHRT